MAGNGMGAPPLSGGVAFGALIIKERLGVSDEETVEQIKENPYLQHFLGYHELLKDAPFDPSMMVHFRCRFPQEGYDEIERIPVEGKFGNVKRGGTLDRVMAKLMCTSVSVINIGLTVLNLDTRLRALLLCLLEGLTKHYVRHAGPTSAPWGYAASHLPWFASQPLSSLRLVS